MELHIQVDTVYVNMRYRVGFITFLNKLHTNHSAFFESWKQCVAELYALRKSYCIRQNLYMHLYGFI